MARLFNTQVFSDVVVGTGAVVTDPKFDELLASADAIALQAIADQASNGSPTLALTLEHSGDRKNWIAKTTLLTPQGLSTTATNVFAGNDPGTTPTLGYARIRINQGVTGQSARVQLYVCGRTT